MQSRTAKSIGAIAIAAMVLGVVIWVSAPSRLDAPNNGLSVTSANATTVAEPVSPLPSNVVTMLGVPEVILNLSPSPEVEANDEKPPLPPKENIRQPTVFAQTLAKATLPVTPKAASSATRKTAAPSSNRASDTFLVKPQ